MRANLNGLSEEDNESRRKIEGLNRAEPNPGRSLSTFQSFKKFLQGKGRREILPIGTDMNSRKDNLFESFLLAVFMLVVLTLVFTEQGPERLCIRTWIWAEVILLFGILLFYPKTRAPERFYDKDLYVVLFHVGRAAALAVMLSASGFYAEFLRTFRRSASQDDLLHMGRNFLVLGTILFLISEYAGILWCLNGWGDFWRWNYGFLSSAFIMLYLMLVFHLPGRGLVSQRMHSIMGAMNSLVFLGITVSRSAP